MAPMSMVSALSMTIEEMKKFYRTHITGWLKEQIVSVTDNAKANIMARPTNSYDTNGIILCN